MIEFILTTLAEFGLIHSDYKHRKRVRRKERKDGVKRPIEKYLFQPSGLILISVLVISVLSSFLFFNYQKTNIYPDKTRNEIIEISNALNKWKNHYGYYPTDLKDITKGKPLRKEWTNDVWKNPYKYNVRENGNSFEIISAGSDREFNTNDDIKSDNIKIDK